MNEPLSLLLQAIGRWTVELTTSGKGSNTELAPPQYVLDQLAVVERAMNDLDRSFTVLGIYGVPRDRARTVANGIEVLMTRMGKADLYTETLSDRTARDQPYDVE